MLKSETERDFCLNLLIINNIGRKRPFYDRKSQNTLTILTHNISGYTHLHKFETSSLTSPPSFINRNNINLIDSTHDLLSNDLLIVQVQMNLSLCEWKVNSGNISTFVHFLE